MKLEEILSEGEVVNFTHRKAEKALKNLPDDVKYDMALAKQQAGDDYDHPAYDPIVARDMEKLGGHYDDPMADELDSEELARILKNAGLDSKEVDEGSKENADALVGSGRADPDGKKTNPDSAAHKKVRTPDTTYSKTRKKYNAGAKPGANDGFVGG